MNGHNQEPDDAGEETLPVPASDAPPRRDDRAAGDTVAVSEAWTHQGRQLAPGDRVGCYRILEVVGSGGFGVVYQAEQTEPVRRRAALKVIKLGMDTRAVVARFEAERQALAMMDHPNVAQVFDAGTTETGRPFFVMEYVAGEQITEYCDRHRLLIRHRLDLFIQVCGAIQHAHQKGIIHRDIKPSNVMVTVRDQRPMVKVIDFGVAKAINQPLTENTVFTAQGQIIGTPEYMSPEQAERTGLDIDTRSDIYSLGVLLYELLTGSRPFDFGELALMEIHRLIAEQDPPRPSTRLSSLGSGGTGAVAQRRRLDSRSLVRGLRGDLDWIVMRCLEKDRSRRYDSVGVLARDLQRHLDDEPVQAGPPSAVYRFRKFARRNRVLLGAASVSLAALLGGVVLAAVGLTMAIHERDEAQMARAESEAVTSFLSRMLRAAIPGVLGRDVKVSQVLDEAAVRLGADFVDRPQIEGRLRHTIGETYRELGLLDQAAPQLERAVRVRREELGVEHPQTLKSIVDLAMLRKAQGRYDEAERLYLEALPVQQRLLGPDDRVTLWTMNNLANVYQAQRRYDESERLKIETLETRRRALGDEDPDTLVSIGNLATLYYAHLERPEEAEPLLLEAYETKQRVLGEDDLSTVTAMHNLGDFLKGQGRYEVAEPLLRRALEQRRVALGDEHHHTTDAVFNLAELYLLTDRPGPALPLCEMTLAADRQRLGDDHRYTLSSLFNLADAHVKLGQHTDALPLLEECVEGRRRKLGPNHRETIEAVELLEEIRAAVGAEEAPDD